MEIKRTFLVLLIVIWMITIFMFSSQNGEDSESTSDIITDKVYELIYGKDEKQYINSYSKMNKECIEYNSRIEKENNKTTISYIDSNMYNVEETIRYEEPHEKTVIRYIIRKIAHFTIYFIGGIIIFLFFNTYNISNTKKIIYTLLFIIVYASCDELHQRFVEARDGKIEDVLIDSLGGMCAVLIMSAKEKISNLKK